jgi:hypothetical protein
MDIRKPFKTRFYDRYEQYILSRTVYPTTLSFLQIRQRGNIYLDLTGISDVPDVRSHIDRLEIQNGSFRIGCGTHGDGIGAVGYESLVTNLIISGGIFEIAGGNAEACIGTANGAAITSIVLQSGSYKLSGPLGIGAAGDSFVGSISIGANSGTVFFDCNSVFGETCVNATNISLGNSSINAIGAGE